MSCFSLQVHMTSVAVTCLDENRLEVEAYHVSSNLICSRLCCPVFVIRKAIVAQSMFA